MKNQPLRNEPLLRIDDNPILIAQARRRLRQKQVVPGVLITVLCGLCGVLGIVVDSPSQREGAWRALCYTALSFIGLVLFLRGTMQTSATIADERRSGILDFHRATPTSPWSDAVGYLLGCAAREYLLAAVAVPFVVLGALRGGLSPLGVVLSLAVMLLSGLLYNAAGLLTGLSIDSRRGVAGASVAVVAALLTLGVSLHRSGLVTLAYLTPYPALARLLEIKDSGMDATVAFYGLALHPVVFTLLVQGSVLGFLLSGSVRKIRREGAAAFSRLSGVGFFSLLVFLFFGGAWDLCHRVVAEQLMPVLASIASFYVIASALLASVMILALTPSYIEFLRALRRARRQGMPEADFLADGGPGWPLIGLFSVLSVAGLAVLAVVLKAPGGLFSREAMTCVAALVAFLALVASAGEYTRLSLRKSARNAGVLIFFLTMVLPWVLFGILSNAGTSHVASLYLASLSPIFALGGGALRMGASWAGEPFSDLGESHLWVSIAVTALLSGWFLLRTRALQAHLSAQIPMGSPQTAR